MTSSTPSRRDVFTPVLPVVSAEDRDRLQLARHDYAELAADLQEHCSEADAQRYVRALQLEDAVDALSRAKGMRAAFLRQRCRRALRTERPWRIGFERSRLGHATPRAIAFHVEHRSGGLRAAAVWIGIGLALTAAGVIVAGSFISHVSSTVRASEHLAEGETAELEKAIEETRHSLSSADDPVQQGQLHGLLGDQYSILAEHCERQGEVALGAEYRQLASDHYARGAERGDAFSHVALGEIRRMKGDLVEAISHHRQAFRAAETITQYRSLRLEAAYCLHRVLVKHWSETGFRREGLAIEALAIEESARGLAETMESSDQLSWIIYNGACLRSQLVRLGRWDASKRSDIIDSLWQAVQSAPADTRLLIAELLLEDEDLEPLRSEVGFEELAAYAQKLLSTSPQNREEGK